MLKYFNPEVLIYIFSSRGRSPGGAIVLPPASALAFVSALALNIDTKTMLRRSKSRIVLESFKFRVFSVTFNSIQGQTCESN